MKLERIPHHPGELLEFYEEGLTKLGALCERTWHDRLHVIAEGRAAKLWHPEGAMHEIELQFAPAEAASARNAAREVFPGCPLTFHLAELMVRAKRSSSDNTRLKTADRLAAAKTEHARRRADQLGRHEIRVHPHLDALLLVAENAWRAQLRVERSRRPQEIEALFIPRSRQWRLASHVCQT